MQKVARRRRGFTLIETVVTVGIIATLAAVVVPQVVNQFDAADPTRLQNDLKGLQSAIETFSVNVKAAPGDVDDLANAIDNTDSTLSTAATLATFLDPSQTTLWNGPYVDFPLVDIFTGDASRTTGYGALIRDSFVCYNAANNAFGTSEGVAASHTTCPTATGQKFLAIQITGLATSAAGANFLALNEMFDGENEATPESNGRVRFAASGTTPTGGAVALTTAVVYFLAIPLN